MKAISFILFYIIGFTSIVAGQPYNRHYLLGYDVGLFDSHVVSTKAKFQFDSTSYALQPDSFKMAFLSSQATISDSNGNLIISTNGCWIADATGDTMQNGSGLNPGSFSYWSNGWCTSSITGNPFPGSSLLLPDPADSSKFILLHLSGDANNLNSVPSVLLQSTIDMNLNGGLGGVVQKNQPVLSDNINSAISATKHANGRDWWVVMHKDSSSTFYVLLFTPGGIQLVNQQSYNLGLISNFSVAPVFSPDGSKFAMHHRVFGSGPLVTHLIRLFDFDRCSGQFTNEQEFTFVDSLSGNGLAFSSDSKYLYWSTWRKIFQLNTDTIDVVASIQQVATNDLYCFPYSFTCTDFWLMYLAANGKIYISSGNGVIDMHYINYPDSAGIACDVRQHAIRLPCYTTRNHVNHPNYALGPVVGSVCDSLGVGVEELGQVRNVKIFPNPVKSGGTITLHYELPQNKAGVFELTDAMCRIVHSYSLPPWSNIQSLQLPALAPGLYFGNISSGNSRKSVKIIVQ